MAKPEGQAGPFDTERKGLRIPGERKQQRVISDCQLYVTTIRIFHTTTSALPLENGPPPVWGDVMKDDLCLSFQLRSREREEPSLTGENRTPISCFRGSRIAIILRSTALASIRPKRSSEPRFLGGQEGGFFSLTSKDTLPRMSQSERRDSNPRCHFGRVKCYHYTTLAKVSVSPDCHTTAAAARCRRRSTWLVPVSTAYWMTY